MPLTSGHSTFPRLGHLVVASLILLGAAPLPGCGDSAVSGKPPVTTSRDAGPRPGGQGGSATGSAGSGGSTMAGTGGTGGNAGSAGDAGLAVDMGPGVPSVDVAPPPPPAGDAGVAEPDAPPEPPPPPPPPPCMANMPCDVPGAAGGKGLCRAAMCAACNGTADDAACAAAYGPNTICAMGRCVVQNCANSRTCPAGQLCESSARVCQACTADAQCKADAVYGMNFICISGKCVDGDCRDSTQCAAGKICGVAMPNNCGNCANSNQCAMDPRYRDHVCVMGTCTPGDCINSGQCNAAKEGLICGSMVRNRCGTCANDAQCAGDAKYRMAGRTTCFVGDGADRGKCVSNACQAVNQRCPQNPATFCCANGNQRTCVAGDCCDNAQCQGGQICVANKCTAAGMGCDGPMGNQLVVDPVNGLDTATGSGRGGGAARGDCAFRTLTRALAAARTGVIMNGTITIVGRGAMTELRTMGGSATDPVEALPIAVPGGVRVTTVGGPVLLRLTSAGAVGFRIEGAAAIEPADNAPLTIDGLGNGGSGIVVTGAGNSLPRLRNIIIRNTGDHGLQIDSAGTNVQLGPNIVVSEAGSAAARRSGLQIAAGTATINQPGNQAAVAFTGNTGAGISVVRAGGLEVTGNPANNVRSGLGTVVVRNNGAQGDQPAGIFIAQDAAANAVRLTGVVVFGQAMGAGIKVVTGLNLRLRNSVVLNNANGVLLAGANGAQDFTRVDLGAVGEPGGNVLQDRGGGSTPNRLAGICFEGLGAAPIAQPIKAQGNQFANVNCAQMAGALVFSPNCMGGADVQVPATVQVDTTMCPPPAPPTPPPPAAGVPF